MISSDALCKDCNKIPWGFYVWPKKSMYGKDHKVIWVNDILLEKIIWYKK